MTNPKSNADPTESDDRRSFLQVAASTAMAGGLLVSYGTFASHAGRFLFPAESGAVGWQFVTSVNKLKLGESLSYTAPTGAKVVIARQGNGETADDFIALSSVCPHLGCQVHWQSTQDRFFCPCHNGAFDRHGKATAGPPATAGQELTRFPLRVAQGLLYIETPYESISQEG